MAITTQITWKSVKTEKAEFGKIYFGLNSETEEICFVKLEKITEHGQVFREVHRDEKSSPAMAFVSEFLNSLRVTEIDFFGETDLTPLKTSKK